MNSLIQSRDWFRRYAWSLLLFNLPVILWGAVVRATGSGAGCNDHWPLCDGAVVPSVFDAHKIIEFSHRITSGLVLLFSALLFAWSVRLYERGEPARIGAGMSFLFTVSEALVGAGLVLFRLVAHDDSVYRAVAISVHLTNTFMLLGALALTAWWASGGRPVALRGQGPISVILMAGLAGSLIIGVTGTVTALGDTLFPVRSVTEIGASVSSSAHFLQHLRVYHPFVALLAGAFAVIAAWTASVLRPAESARNLAFVVSMLFAVQVSAGFLNLFLKAPIGMQLVHLLLADSLWISLVLLTASALAVGAPRVSGVANRRIGFLVQPSGDAPEAAP